MTLAGHDAPGLHPNCTYLAASIDGEVWFCNKCGFIGGYVGSGEVRSTPDPAPTDRTICGHVQPCKCGRKWPERNAT